ncbi:hypothetical protein Hamer_G012605 [Homarus americanus]|uniref:Uncharacterized protein n=1 Tax=Homarus americanus TaxID=6706 RepID=A0A8J5N0N5_HOMAM|nr:hypothetical protein Hamer_G012605 [Homarus americanus]
MDLYHSSVMGQPELIYDNFCQDTSMHTFELCVRPRVPSLVPSEANMADLECKEPFDSPGNNWLSPW